MSTTKAWQDYLQRARWFGGKGLGARIVEITGLEWYTPADTWPAVRSELARLEYADGRQEVYHLLVSYLPPGQAPAGLPVGRAEVAGLGEVDFLDAPSDPGSIRALVKALLAQPPEGMTWTNPDPVDPDGSIRLFTGEQSNTSVMIGETTLLKLIRKLEPGRNLDAEVLGALSGSHITPDLFGVISQQDYDLGLFCQRITGITDGWVYATEACAADRDLSEECRRLGAELKELHLRLADAFGVSHLRGDRLSETMIRRFNEAVGHVGELEEYRAAAEMLFAAPVGHNLTTQRVHGDFHLGQVLHRADAPENTWVIIDFEGEPLKTLAERREFDSVWRDVAGALRSLDYARSSHPDPESAAARAWCAAAKAAFLEGYCGDHRAEPTLLRAYELDKAVYEVVYEVRNRPDWAQIPWRAVQDEANSVSLNPPALNNKEM